MIDWIDAMGRTWGYQVRRHIVGETPIPSLAGRVADLGPVGASIRSPQQIHKEVLMGDALLFHIAFQNLGRAEDKEIIANHYVIPRPVKAKTHALGIPRSTYWQRLHYAHRRIEEVLECGQRPYRLLAQSSVTCV